MPAKAASAARHPDLQQHFFGRQIEAVGAKLLDIMPWIKAGALVDKAKN